MFAALEDSHLEDSGHCILSEGGEMPQKATAETQVKKPRVGGKGQAVIP